MSTWDTLESSLKEALSNASQKLASGWFERAFNITPGSFTENLLVDVIGALIVAGVFATIGIIVSRRMWLAIRLHLRAATIRKVSGKAFVIVECPIKNDKDNGIGNEIAARLETAFRAFSGWNDTDNRSFEVIAFPLSLPVDEGTRSYDRGIEIGKKWLDNTNGDILIWGKRTSGKSTGIIRLIGKDRRRGVIETRRIDFNSTAEHFDEALAAAIAYEVAQLTQTTLSEPESVPLDVLRDTSKKVQRLASNEAPALSMEWRRQMRSECWRLTLEIARRSPVSSECDELEAGAREELASLDLIESPLRFAQLSLLIAILVRRRNWAEPNPDELEEARTRLDRAIRIFETMEMIWHSAETSMERVLIRRIERFYMTKERQKADQIYATAIREARQRVEKANDERQQVRLNATLYFDLNPSDLADICHFDKEGPSGAFLLIANMERHLDNSEIIDLSNVFANVLAVRGDTKVDANYWEAAPQIPRAVLNSRSPWSQDERRLLDSIIATWSFLIGHRLYNTNLREAARPYLDAGQMLAKQLISSPNWNVRPRRFIDFRILYRIGSSLAGDHNDRDTYDCGLMALRICAGPAASEFPGLQSDSISQLIASLNNYAVAFNSLSAAEEALELAASVHSDDCFGKYVAAFAAWQTARLTAPDDKRCKARGSHAHLMALAALKMASDEHYQLCIDGSQMILQRLAIDFPEYAHDLTVIAPGHNSERK